MISNSSRTIVQQKPLISVVIPTHNRAHLLQDALRSVYDQEGAGEEFEIEVVVVDDASSDSTPEIMNNYPETQYIRLESNRGASAARNIGIKASKGNFITLLDDDDLWLSHRIKMHLPVLEANPEVGALYGQIISTGDCEPTLWPEASKAPSGWVFHSFLMEEFIMTNCVMIRREAFEKAGYFDEDLGTMEHYDMFLRLSYYVPIMFIPGAISIGRFSEQGKWFTNIRAGNFQRAVSFIVERALDMLPSTAETAELRRKARLSWFSQITCLLQQAGRVDGMRNHVLTSIRTNPWIMTEVWARPSLMQSMTSVACNIAMMENSPISAVRAFLREFKAVLPEGGKSKLRETRSLLARVWISVGNDLIKTDSLLHRRAARYATAFAISNDLTLLRQKSVWRRIVLANPRWDAMVAILKRMMRA